MLPTEPCRWVGELAHDRHYNTITNTVCPGWREDVGGSPAAETLTRGTLGLSGGSEPPGGEEHP